MGLKSQIALIRKANKLLRHEAGELQTERDNYRTAYQELLRKQNQPMAVTSGGLRMRHVKTTQAS